MSSYERTLGMTAKAIPVLPTTISFIPGPLTTESPSSLCAQAGVDRSRTNAGRHCQGNACQRWQPGISAQGAGQAGGGGAAQQVGVAVWRCGGVGGVVWTSPPRDGLCLPCLFLLNKVTVTHANPDDLHMCLLYPGVRWRAKSRCLDPTIQRRSSASTTWRRSFKRRAGCKRRSRCTGVKGVGDVGWSLTFCVARERARQHLQLIFALPFLATL